MQSSDICVGNGRDEKLKTRMLVKWNGTGMDRKNVTKWEWDKEWNEGQRQNLHTKKWHSSLSTYSTKWVDTWIVKNYFKITEWGTSREGLQTALTSGLMLTPFMAIATIITPDLCRPMHDNDTYLDRSGDKAQCRPCLDKLAVYPCHSRRYLPLPWRR